MLRVLRVLRVLRCGRVAAFSTITGRDALLASLASPDASVVGPAWNILPCQFCSRRTAASPEREEREEENEKEEEGEEEEEEEEEEGEKENDGEGTL